MRKLLLYLLERLGILKVIDLDDPIMEETVNGVKRRAIILALIEGKQK